MGNLSFLVLPVFVPCFPYWVSKPVWSWVLPTYVCQ